MDIHEYQAKEILQSFGVTIPRGGIVYSPETAENKAREIGGSKWVVKAQIHSGARGKAMATMDLIKLAGAEPANFLDVGGTADKERVEKAFRLILRDSNVKAILVNIFGGIVRCDRVAEGIVSAYKNLDDINVPIIVRLQGTNADMAKEIIDNSGLNVVSAITFDEVANKVQSAIR